MNLALFIQYSVLKNPEHKQFIKKEKKNKKKKQCLEDIYSDIKRIFNAIQLCHNVLFYHF